MNIVLEAILLAAGILASVVMVILYGIMIYDFFWGDYLGTRPAK